MQRAIISIVVAFITSAGCAQSGPTPYTRTVDPSHDERDSAEEEPEPVEDARTSSEDAGMDEETVPSAAPEPEPVEEEEEEEGEEVPAPELEPQIRLGPIACGADGAEPNEVRPQFEALSEQRDAPDSHQTYTAYRISSRGDIDWFRVPINDLCCDGAGQPNQPRMTVTLDDIPDGGDYDLGAWFVCETGTNVSDCERGTADNLDEDHVGCVSTNRGSDSEVVQLLGRCQRAINQQEGHLYIRVQAREYTGTCEEYRLRVDVI